ncbi:bifunctional 23S rRNA (guanine(2069)-N(7))-methyltransferase RlmK/23S rRNA (guanine(2445)-N(2))-methyltransferase RlmL [Rhodoferax sp. 4810]|uniref:Ribosomal RNA large subunit methyltransferase K/L n=1 Tax=Thiospirillum jenense TaxID=1653858 RepID=A0A839H5R2_9GAMM|nr:bifunctional 23S rRNA (guanine(2069)-N(7))-methyltransferase RlmK/23S rRNA (guanine(2445)-N(2))-methyltransferase RlmL [Thiospirillum jenense]MBB1074181.1 bifunctional 23S rRNA (guanine(2069)-N(7))-methyltransferase RlmK/23S rRNA (guanine(2445)-N(2))-methyltransferase RlmL [Rhodoferax jenense]MBB1125255.1 bifunctional 23S rRNA (guanine(2069)-N(7))-methyltransferase RlmK/23S rRNA (guanine(2445)-N(2))-methyltransferase RlmL [Thiospirillum jenense]
MKFFVTTARHLEALLTSELCELGLKTAHETRAGAHLTGNLTDAYRACLWSRVANRVLLPLAQFTATDAEALYAGTDSIDWSAHFSPAQTFAVQVDCAQSQLTHSHFAALKIKDAIVDQFRRRSGERPSVDVSQPDIRLYAHLFRDEVTLSLDLSGHSLHRRGYREQLSAASMKETLAAAVLLRAGWAQLAADGAALFDPMCGAGTLPIEAALIAADIAPGLQRQQWGFTAWHGHDAAAWAALVSEAAERRAAGLARWRRDGGSITGYDAQPSAIRAALGNLARADLIGDVHFECRDLSASRPRRAGDTGLVVVNPPYGERLSGDEGELENLYAQLGQLLRDRFDGWHAAVLTANPELGKQIGLRATRQHRLFNGQLDCRLLHFSVTPALVMSHQPRPLPVIERSAGAEMFANRLRKNRRTLTSWLQREQISCYRLYDADLPEYAVAVDIYTSVATATAPARHFAQVQEYAAPASIDPTIARRRLREAVAVIAEELQLPASAVVCKIRQRQRGTAQYERQDAAGQWLTVAEDGLQLLVNLTDYLDTGLFLDHRLTRRQLRDRAAGRRFLNLFGYTATASCYAAAGGALSTTTVDLSNTYCDWARRNLALNGFAAPQHRVIQAECLEWLTEAQRARQQFDLIFLDPPTFSTSKRMTTTFDVQRDHVDVIQAAVALLAAGGELIFSTNRRGFRLDQAALAEWQPEDITRSTIPRDFARTPQVHRCWRFKMA